MKKDRYNLKHVLTIGLFLIIVVGCTGQDSGMPLVWIDVPINDLTFPLGSTINIEGHAADKSGISYIEILINGELVWTIDELISSDGLVKFTQLWTPESEGDYIIHAIAYRSSTEFSNPTSATVHIGIPEDTQVVMEDTPIVMEDTQAVVEEAPTEEITATPEPPLSEPTIQFWADSPEVEAGLCTTLHWRVENVGKVKLGNTEVPLVGDYEACHCKNTSYSLTIIHQDATEEVITLPINVIGECVTPQPTTDKTPPSIPVQLKPINGSDIGCVGDTFLRWQAATDESGIAEYQIQAQRHPGDNNWQNVTGSPWNGIGDTKLLFSTECGWTYRWRVRAVDKAGNESDWSGWFTFSLPLT